MKLVLTGATGFLGQRTLEHLVNDDRIHSIIANGRKIKNEIQVFKHEKIKYLLGDVSDEKFAFKLLLNATHVVHAAGLSSPWGTYTDFEKANLITQKNLISAAKKNQLKKFIHISTPSMYFELLDKMDVKEDDPLPKNLVNDYALTKRLAEIELINSELPYVILRPRALIGRGDTVIMPRLIRAHQEGRLKIIGNGENLADLTAVVNVAEAIRLSLFAEDKALNEIYNITNGEPIKLWESISWMLTQLKLDPPTKKIPFSLVYFIASLLEIKAKINGNQEPALTKYGVGTLAKTITLDISKAKKLLKYKPIMNNEEGMDEFVKWYLEHATN
ncbi:MAG: NAD-dependent epimerase/dehydratase family protein [Bacteroidota bacterium]